jgi:hypothetical protein
MREPRHVRRRSNPSRPFSGSNAADRLTWLTSPPCQRPELA